MVVSSICFPGAAAQYVCMGVKLEVVHHQISDCRTNVGDVVCVAKHVVVGYRRIQVKKPSWCATMTGQSTYLAAGKCMYNTYLHTICCEKRVLMHFPLFYLRIAIARRPKQ